eukprot:CAMPEP_0168756396 /NCGR_PEP_ID=MMETSP0724-20121128/20591_1 /TAXON_ID=265536 /ORGANISM="Amphiprora sp., Strain CCMP467" /LENGTH=94 /DNA_ID=CAMNT_0008805097 /DNA_START=156 /DNA_END=439 /DNA_ORIENTATION=+
MATIVANMSAISVFRRMIEEKRPEYQALVRKGAKTKIARTIFQTIKKMGGRFLDKRKQDGVEQWCDIPDDRAQAKISQALRNRGENSSSEKQED